MDEAELNEAKTRKTLIDKALAGAGWGPVVPYSEEAVWLHGSVEEYPTSKGPADYILFDQGKAIACVEGKKVKVAPMNVLQQANKVCEGLSARLVLPRLLRGILYPLHLFHERKDNLVSGPEERTKPCPGGCGLPHPAGPF
jgi:type I site-specific restriction endonuclease